tara:strand:- start:1338 stop:1541 length:204 start_codon:yes stop_codon:yes gene_type:complete
MNHTSTLNGSIEVTNICPDAKTKRVTWYDRFDSFVCTTVVPLSCDPRSAIIAEVTASIEASRVEVSQ